MVTMLVLALACTPGDPASATSDTSPRDSVPADSHPPDSDPPDSDPPAVPPNVLLVVLDDIGVDKVGAYNPYGTAPPTPTLDALAERGVVFENAWVYPGCTPTRAALLTGRHGYRTGLGRVLTPEVGTHWLLEDEVTVPEVLAGAGYTSAAIGKWHLVAWEAEEPAEHPRRQGFGTFRGLLANVHQTLVSSEEGLSYWYWEKVVDGTTAFESTYLTTDQADDVLALTGELPEPWFVYASFTAPHDPFHAPPEELVSEPPEEGASIAQLHHAMVESVDSELGRVFDAMDPEVAARTLVVLLGDNGTPRDATVEPADPERVKETLYDGGVNVPMLVAGPGVAPGRTEALVHAVDLLPTLAELAGVDLTGLTRTEGEQAGELVTLDGVSWLPVLSGGEGSREHLHVEMLHPLTTGAYEVEHYAVRSATHKLIRYDGGGEQLFRYDDGEPDEGPDRLAERSEDAELAAAYEALAAELERWRGGLAYGP